MVAAVVLAAAGGPRYGGAQALLRVDGVALIERALLAARDAGCDPVLVVLGCEADRVRTEVDLGAATVVANPQWRGGLGSSVRAGLAALAEHADPVPAVVLLPVDTPGASTPAIQRMTDGADEHTLRVATYDGQRGYPVLVGRDHWAGMSVLATSDVGARAYLTAHSDRVVPVNCTDVALSAACG